jgi:periplasmic divalent cation tolerance protein
MAVLVVTTCPGEEESRKIADSLLNKRLCACVNVVPQVESRYWWKGKLERGKENLLLIKTTEENVDAVTEEIKKMHSYGLPEVITLEITGGSGEYLEWVRKESS